MIRWLDKLGEARRERAGEVHVATRHRVHEAESLRMECKAVYRRRAGTVAPVARYGVAGVLHMHANLVFTACGKAEFNH